MMRIDKIHIIYIILFLLLSSCDNYNKFRFCDSSYLPYQYKVVHDNDTYYATLVKLDSGTNIQTFFLSESMTPISDLIDIQRGGPSGQIVRFERDNNLVTSKELDILYDINTGKNSDRKYDIDINGIRYFIVDGRKFHLFSCSGIFSIKFKQEFKNLFS